MDAGHDDGLGTEDNIQQSLEQSTQGRVLDPTDSDRQYWRESGTGIVREVWRPGDGDGSYGEDHYGKSGPLAPIDRRWRFYQLSHGTVVARENEPPKFVVLDDLAAYEVLAAGIPKAQRCRNWDHDFGGPAKVRIRRPHRGRPAIRDLTAQGNDKYHTTFVGSRKTKYWFCGEKEYTAVIYRHIESDSVVDGGESDPIDIEQARPRQHNQHTAKHLLVRNGVQSDSHTKGKYRSRLNAFLRKSSSPPTRAHRTRAFTTRMSGEHNMGSNATTLNLDEDDSLWVNQDDDGFDEELPINNQDDDEGDPSAHGEYILATATNTTANSSNNINSYLSPQHGNDPFERTKRIRSTRRTFTLSPSASVPRKKHRSNTNALEGSSAQSGEQSTTTLGTVMNANDTSKELIDTSPEIKRLLNLITEEDNWHDE